MQSTLMVKAYIIQEVYLEWQHGNSTFHSRIIAFDSQNYCHYCQSDWSFLFLPSLSSISILLVALEICQFQMQFWTLILSTLEAGSLAFSKLPLVTESSPAAILDTQTEHTI